MGPTQIQKFWGSFCWAFLYFTRSCIKCINKSKMDGSFVSRRRSRSLILNNKFYLEQDPYLLENASVILQHQFGVLPKATNIVKNTRNAKKWRRKKIMTCETWKKTRDRRQVILKNKIMQRFCVCCTRLKKILYPKEQGKHILMTDAQQVFFIELSYMVSNKLYKWVRLWLLMLNFVVNILWQYSH